MYNTSIGGMAERKATRQRFGQHRGILKAFVSILVGVDTTIIEGFDDWIHESGHNTFKSRLHRELAMSQMLELSPRRSYLYLV